MGDSLAFHIAFAFLGVGLPMVISLFELLGIIKKDTEYRAIARRWTFAMSTLFVTGAISGTVVSFQLNLLWPHFMAFAGQVIALPFFMEGFAFFIEAIFLGIYVYTWDRFSPFVHWLCSLPIVLGSAASAFFITTANAFMNSPEGFTYQNGVISDVHPWRAMFNTATPYETSHSILSYYLATCFVLAGLYAFLALRKRVRPQSEKLRIYKKVITPLMIAGLVLAIAVGIAGDISGKYLAEHEPLKFAASEAIIASRTYVPFEYGGFFENGSLTGALTINGGVLSYLAFGTQSAFVRGLDAFDPSLWPPLWIHYVLDLMVTIGVFFGAVALLFITSLKWRPNTAFGRPMLWAITICAPLAVTAIECGWMLTEIGRQPWAIRGVMTTADAFTSSTSVLQFAFLFPAFYIVLFGVTYYVLRRHYSNSRISHG